MVQAVALAMLLRDQKLLKCKLKSVSKQHLAFKIAKRERVKKLGAFS